MLFLVDCYRLWVTDIDCTVYAFIWFHSHHRDTLILRLYFLSSIVYVTFKIEIYTDGCRHRRWSSASSNLSVFVEFKHNTVTHFHI